MSFPQPAIEKRGYALGRLFRDVYDNAEPAVSEFRYPFKIVTGSVVVFFRLIRRVHRPLNPVAGDVPLFQHISKMSDWVEIHLVMLPQEERERQSTSGITHNQNPPSSLAGDCSARLLFCILPTVPLGRFVRAEARRQVETVETATDR